MRKKIAAGNWKMNTTPTQGNELGSEVIGLSEKEISSDVEIVLGAPYTHLMELVKLSSGSKVKISAQNCHQESSGAYTGEISCEMLVDLGISHVIIAHSERREYFSESNDLIASKVDAALNAGLIPIFCCGEKLEVREAGAHFDLVSTQIEEALFHLTEEAFSKIVIAYEPVWAIGTGVTASSEQAQEMHAFIRNFISDKYGDDLAQQISILYGGSVQPGNAAEIFGCPDVDGGLVGGASLNSRDFIDIAKAF